MSSAMSSSVYWSGAEAAREQSRARRRRDADVRRAPAVAVVEAHDVVAALDELGDQPGRPVQHLHAEAHDQQQRRVGAVAERLAAQLDAAADVDQPLAVVGGDRLRPAGRRAHRLRR